MNTLKVSLAEKGGGEWKEFLHLGEPVHYHHVEVKTFTEGKSSYEIYAEGESEPIRMLERLQQPWKFFIRRLDPGSSHTLVYQLLNLRVHTQLVEITDHYLHELFLAMVAIEVAFMSGLQDLVLETWNYYLKIAFVEDLVSKYEGAKLWSLPPDQKTE